MLLLFLLTGATASLYDWREAGVHMAASLLQEEAIGGHHGPLLVALVRPLLAQANSAVIVHDGSPIAQSVTHDLVSPQSVTHVLTSPQSVTHNLTSPQSVTHDPISSQSVTHDLALSQSVTHELASPQSVTHDLISPQSVTHDPTSPQRVTHDLTSPQRVTHEPTLPQSVTLDPTSPQSVTHVLASPQSVTNDFTPPQSVPLDLTSPKSVTHDPISSQSVTHDLASPQSVTYDPTSQPPLLLGDMTRLLADPPSLTTFPGHRLNTHLGLTLFLFSNVSVVTRFLAAKPPGWVTTSLLLISLSLHHDARGLLVETQEVRWSALLEARRTPSSRLRHFIINFLPFNPPGSQFHHKACDGRPLTRGQVFLERYSHFHGRQLQVASWLDDFPFLFHDTSGQVQGLAKVMLDEVASRLHFTYHLQEEPPDGYWGELVNGTWMGMAGQLVRQEKDLIIDGFAILLDRYHSLDLSVPYFTDSYSAALKVPPPAPRWVAVVYPFQGVVWAGVAAALLLLTITLHAVVHRHPRSLCTHGGRLAWTMLWAGGWLVRQSSSWVPQGSRPLLAAWWLAGLVLSTSYTGSITAFLSVPRQAPRISTLQHLAQDDNKLFLMDYGAFLPGYLRTSVDPVYRTLGKKLHLLDSYEAIKVQMEAGHAFVEGTHYTQAKLIGWRMADAYVVEEKMFPNYNGWAFRKGTPWTPTFNKYLLRMRESGLVDHWYSTTLAAFRREHGLAPSQPQDGLLLLRPLSLSDSQGAFILMGFGIALAIVTFILEFVCCGEKVRESDGHS